MRLELTGLAVIAGIVVLQLAGVAIFAPAALAAQFTLEVLARCCGSEVGAIGAIVVFLGLIALTWYAITRLPTGR